MIDYLAWRISYQSSEQAARAAYEQLHAHHPSIEQDILIMKLLFIFITLTIWTAVAFAQTPCERNWADYPKTGRWDRHCGPEPGKNVAAERKKDCLATIEQINAQPEGSAWNWNAYGGWAPEEQCWQFVTGNKVNL